MIESAPGDPGLVSVLIPMYNHAAYVADCLSSVVADGYAPLDVQIIDDGSRDDSFAVAKAWRRDHPTAFTHFEITRQDNAGLNKTLNRLLKRARGQYICLLASDDMLAPGGIAARVAALRAHSEWRAVFGDCDVIDGDGRQTYASAYELHGADKVALADPRRIETELIWRWSVPGPVLLVDRRIYFGADGYGLYPEDRIVEDRDFYLSVLAKGQLGFVDHRVASYRLHGANTSRKREQEIVEQIRDAERLIRNKFGLRARAGLSFKLLMHDLQTRGRLSQARLPRLAGSLAEKIDRHFTKFVLTRNSRRARRS